MPHLKLAGTLDLEHVARQLPRDVHRWGRAVLKTEECWLRRDAGAVLVEGTVVELGRPLHPVALVAAGGDSTTVRLWARLPVERTPAVQRWLCVVAAGLTGLGLGRVEASNIAVELRADLGLA